MKKVIILMLLMCSVSISAFASYGDEEIYTASSKFGRGVEGIATSYFEYSTYLEKEKANQSIMTAFPAALVAGTVLMGKRVINGVGDILTFPFELQTKNGLLIPDDYPTALDKYQSLRN